MSAAGTARMQRPAWAAAAAAGWTAVAAAAELGLAFEGLAGPFHMAKDGLAMPRPVSDASLLGVIVDGP